MFVSLALTRRRSLSVSDLPTQPLTLLQESVVVPLQGQLKALSEEVRQVVPGMRTQLEEALNAQVEALKAQVEILKIDKKNDERTMELLRTEFQRERDQRKIVEQRNAALVTRVEELERDCKLQKRQVDDQQAEKALLEERLRKNFGREQHPAATLPAYAFTSAVAAVHNEAGEKTTPAKVGIRIRPMIAREKASKMETFREHFKGLKIARFDVVWLVTYSCIKICYENLNFFSFLQIPFSMKTRVRKKPTRR